jgi:DNA modification methylase
MKKVKKGSARLVFAEPRGRPGGRTEEATLADTWWTRWLKECARVLQPDGSLWVLVDDDEAAHLVPSLRNGGFHLRAWIKVQEEPAREREGNFACCSRHLFYCVLDPDHFVFHEKRLTGPELRKGGLGAPLTGDVWKIRHVEEGNSEGAAGISSQLPLALLRPIIHVASDPGDLVVDPFSGSATTGVAALECGRDYTGIEKDPAIAEQSRDRLKRLGAEKAAAT